MISEKNQAVEDLQNVEAAFADVHRKYERTKQVVEVSNPVQPQSYRATYYYIKLYDIQFRALRRTKNS